jgi:NADH-quinone oxidoreductase subunit N
MTDIVFPAIGWLAALPALLVTGTALVVLAVDMAISSETGHGLHEVLAWLGVLGLVAAMIASAALWNLGGAAFGNTLVADRYGLFFTVLVCGASAVVTLMAVDFLEIARIRIGEFYSLVLFATAGMVLMATGNDLMVLFLGLEIMSLAVYVLAGIARDEPRATEAALKYFLLGAYATGFFLFGIALLYGATGATRLDLVAARLGAESAANPLVLLGVGFLLVGFGFKIAMMPFHAWTPDVYEGAPTAVTTLMAVGVKAAAFAAFARVFLHDLPGLEGAWTGVLWLLAALTMTVGNLCALAQQNVKRMLAYSSIAHAGYALVGMVAGTPDGGASVLFYLLAYALTNLGAFGVVMALGRVGAANERLEDYAGVGFAHPLLGFAMAVSMLSLTGMPPLVGFAGKFYLFSAAVDAGYVGLAVIGVLNSLVSAYYYFGVIRQMYMVEGTPRIDPLAARPYLAAGLIAAVGATVALGLFPAGAMHLARDSFLGLG